MEAFIITVGVLSILGFLLNYLDKKRLIETGRGYATAFMICTGILAPFGALIGMLLFNNRLKSKLMLILVLLMLAALVGVTYLLRAEIY